MKRREGEKSGNGGIAERKGFLFYSKRRESEGGDFPSLSWDVLDCFGLKQGQLQNAESTARIGPIFIKFRLEIMGQTRTFRGFTMVKGLEIGTCGNWNVRSGVNVGSGQH